MAKKSGSKSSRSERRAGRKRAERAVQHGLPTRKVPPPRVRAATPEPGSAREGTERSSDAPRTRAAKAGGIPPLVKVLGAALIILVGVYLLSRQRDEALTETKPAPEPPAAAISAAPSVPAAAEPTPVAPEVTAVPEVTAAPVTEPPAAVVSVTPPTKPVVVAPVVAAPVVAAPSKPKVEKAVVAPSPAPAIVAAPAAVPVAPAPVAAPPPAAVPAPPKPVAPKAPAAPPADNPY